VSDPTCDKCTKCRSFQMAKLNITWRNACCCHLQHHQVSPHLCGCNGDTPAESELVLSCTALSAKRPLWPATCHNICSSPFTLSLQIFTASQRDTNQRHLSLSCGFNENNSELYNAPKDLHITLTGPVLRNWINKLHSPAGQMSHFIDTNTNTPKLKHGHQTCRNGRLKHSYFLLPL
jgi:hypothetical protein